MILTSPSFLNNQMIPTVFTCNGDDISPALNWSAVPASIAQFALLMDDPDAPGGTWSHWVIYGIPAACRGLDENVPALPELPNGSRQGRNSWGRTGYGGPCPPSGTHRYIFQLYALSQVLPLEAGLSSGELQKAIHNYIQAEAPLIGLYHRKR